MSATSAVHRALRTDGFAAGQAIAMLAVLLLFLPLLPFVLVVIAVVRVRDRLTTDRPAHQPASLTQPAPMVQPPAA
ncbi:hypothetical protein [Phytohabitans kaempferiae]|uniref:Uncharacterized protein n=1 Tax=Phytohabitans kaempferiae TaxID=1620943 RepID=A0ABV6M9E3_9ACTN